MITKIIFTILWAVLFFFGTAIILGFGSGTLIAIMIGAGQEIPEDGILVKMLGASWVIGPMLLGPLGLALGALGVLPGTNLKQKRQPNNGVEATR